MSENIQKDILDTNILVIQCEMNNILSFTKGFFKSLLKFKPERTFATPSIGYCGIETTRKGVRRFFVSKLCLLRGISSHILS